MAGMLGRHSEKVAKDLTSVNPFVQTGVVIDINSYQPNPYEVILGFRNPSISMGGPDNQGTANQPQGTGLTGPSVIVKEPGTRKPKVLVGPKMSNSSPLGNQFGKIGGVRKGQSADLIMSGGNQQIGTITGLYDIISNVPENTQNPPSDLYASSSATDNVRKSVSELSTDITTSSSPPLRSSVSDLIYGKVDTETLRTKLTTIVKNGADKFLTPSFGIRFTPELNSKINSKPPVKGLSSKTVLENQDPTLKNDYGSSIRTGTTIIDQSSLTTLSLGIP